jgi:hypothetical protein
MRSIMIVGLVLVILAVLALGYQGVAYITTRDTVAKIGPVEVQVDREHAIPLAPILSGLALVGGIGLLIIGATRPKAT